jgi:phage-related protein
MSDWTVQFASEAALAEVKALPLDLQSKLTRIVDLVEANGLAALPASYVKHLEDKLWEIRLSGKAGIARSIYVTASGQRVIILRTFVKKTQKTPRREIDLAHERARKVK